MISIQRTIDRLSDRLGRPTAIDDPAYRLLYYSPQRGPLDPVRIDSILHRDSPPDAKAWVTSQGVSEVQGARRVAGAPELGLLPRICAPIRHDGTLLGYLWVIDAEENLTSTDLQAVVTAADSLAPALYRVRTLERLDRQHERETLAALLSTEVGRQLGAASRLESSGLLVSAASCRVVVADAVVAPEDGFADAQRVGLEAAFERSRSFVSEPEVAYLTEGARGTVLLVGGAVDTAGSFAGRLLAECERQLPDLRWVVGVGSPRRRLVDARASLDEAVATTRMLARVPSLGDVLEHQDLGVYATLARIPDALLTVELVPQALRELLEEDTDGELTTTLECYLDLAGDVMAAARRLHVHRSTVYTRLQRIERITHVDLRQGRHRLTLHLGLVMTRVVGLWPRA